MTTKSPAKPIPSESQEQASGWLICHTTDCSNIATPGVDTNGQPHKLCKSCAELARKERYKKKNPAFKDLVSMNGEDLSQFLMRLREAREARGEDVVLVGIGNEEIVHYLSILPLDDWLEVLRLVKAQREKS